MLKSQDENHSIVLHATPQVRVFLNGAGEIQIAINETGEEHMLFLPVPCAEAVARAILACAERAKAPGKR